MSDLYTYAIATTADVMALSQEDRDTMCDGVAECMASVRYSLDDTKIIFK